MSSPRSVAAPVRRARTSTLMAATAQAKSTVGESCRDSTTAPAISPAAHGRPSMSTLVTGSASPVATA
jgi:hypothetical protein